MSLSFSSTGFPNLSSAHGDPLRADNIIAMRAALALGQGILNGTLKAPLACHARVSTGLVDGLRASLKQVVAASLALALNDAQTFGALHVCDLHAVVLQLFVNRIRPLELLACIDVVCWLMNNSPCLLWLHWLCLIKRDRLSDSLAKHTAKWQLVGACFLADLLKLVSASVIVPGHEICVPLHLIDDLATVQLLDSSGVL